MQQLRNCSGTGRPARVELNGSFYERCPRAIYLEATDARYFMRVYLECRKTNTYPSPGTAINQTAFCINVFEYIDELMAIHRLKEQNTQLADIKKSQR